LNQIQSYNPVKTMNAFRKSVLIRGFAWLGVLLGMAWWPVGTWANPTGGQVVLGNANISTLDPSNLLIEQLSDRALIQWDSFSIAAGEITRFVQPGSGSVALNRVVGATPSQLNGLLQGNGNVWLMNSSGVIVGAGGRVDVGGFMASTLDMSNDEFARGGSFRLSGASTAAVRNFGTIRAANGDVYLAAHEVQNAGAIGALNGTVALAGGNEVLINPGGAHGEKVFVSGGGGSVVNSGQITSAFAELRAHGNPHAIAVQNPGSIRATGAETVGGRVVLRAGTGDISSTGTVEAIGSGLVPGSVAMNAGSGEVRIGGLVRAGSETGNGGSIGLVGRSVQVEAGAELDTDGVLGGGAIDVAAGEIVIYGNSTLSASGAVGGDINLKATGGVLVAGRMATEGTDGAGGSISATGQQVVLMDGAELDASGASGGEIRVGGGLQGKDSTIANALTVQVDQGVRLAADGRNGDGGMVVLYSEQGTRFGERSTRGPRERSATGGLSKCPAGENCRLRGWWTPVRWWGGTARS
jgi:filamentous hemagglutinin family protein